MIFFLKNYGTAQGKSIANLISLANDAGVNVSKFVPPEAETVEDVRIRCVSFFNVSLFLILAYPIIVYLQK